MNSIEDERKRLVADAVDRIVRDNNSNISYYAKRIAEFTERIANARKESEKLSHLWAEAWSRLEAAGFEPVNSYERMHITLEVKPEELTRVYKAIGRLDAKRIEKDAVSAEDAEAGIVTITLPAVNYPNVKVRFKRKLEATDRCKLVQRVSTYYELVCNTKRSVENLRADDAS